MYELLGGSAVRRLGLGKVALDAVVGQIEPDDLVVLLKQLEAIERGKLEARELIDGQDR